MLSRVLQGVGCWAEKNLLVRQSLSSSRVIFSAECWKKAAIVPGGGIGGGEDVATAIVAVPMTAAGMMYLW